MQKHVIPSHETLNFPEYSIRAKKTTRESMKYGGPTCSETLNKVVF